MLPTTRHIKELINHAEDHINHGEESDLKFSLIHADNSIEIMLKEYLRYNKEKSWSEIDRKGFYDLLTICEDVDLIKESKDYFLAYHDIRNSVYHTGTLVPLKEDVEAALGLAKTLFNELHPNFKFVDAKIKVPSKKSIQNIMHVLGSKPYLNEISLVRAFSNYLERERFEVFPEYVVAGKIRADIVAMKDEELIICEIKLGGVKRLVDRRTLSKLKIMYDHLKENNPDKEVKGWLITDGLFSSIVKKVAKKYNIRLIDGQELNQILK